MKIVIKIVKDWCWDNNYVKVVKGRIWIIWKGDLVNLEVLNKYE